MCTGLRPPALTFRFGLAQHTQHLCVGGVLAQGPQHIPTLSIRDLHLASWGPVKQREGLFELCREKTQLQLLAPSGEGAGAHQPPPQLSSTSLCLYKALRPLSWALHSIT